MGVEVSQGVAAALARGRRRRQSTCRMVSTAGLQRSPDLPDDRRDARQVGDARAPEDRPHRLSVADPALHRSAGGVPLRAGRGRARRRQGDRRHALRHRRRRVRPSKASAAPSMRSCASTASRIRRSTISPTSSAAPTPRVTISRRSAAGLLAISLGPVRELSGRSRDAGARHGDVRRALHLVPQRSRRRPTTGRPPA